MKYLLEAFLLAGLLAGCTNASNSENAAKTVSPGISDTIVTPTMGSSGEATMENAPSASKQLTITSIPLSIPTGSYQDTPALPLSKDAPSGSEPMAITVRPPMFPIGSDSTPLPGWQTFTSTAQGVAVNYPLDWSVTENNDGTIFKSPQGLTILLQADNNNADSSSAGQDCTTLINTYGQACDLCFDAAIYSYRAIFKRPVGQSIQWLVLSTISQEKPTVFFQMFNSLHFTP
jgi:hypothetical protein